MNPRKRSPLILSSFLIFLISWNSPEKIYTAINQNLNFFKEAGSNTLFENHLQSIYDSCHLKNKSLEYGVFKKGMIGYFNMKKKEILSDKSVITIIDFQKPSKDERMWVIDFRRRKVLFYSWWLMVRIRATAMLWIFQIYPNPS